MTADETHNNNIRANAINNTIPGQVQINAIQDCPKSFAMNAAEPKVFDNATDADVTCRSSARSRTYSTTRRTWRTASYSSMFVHSLPGYRTPDGTPKNHQPSATLGLAAGCSGT